MSKKAGRPRLSEREKHTDEIKVYLRDDEHEQLLQAAARMGLSLSSYLRSQSLNAVSFKVAA